MRKKNKQIELPQGGGLMSSVIDEHSCVDNTSLKTKYIPIENNDSLIIEVPYTSGFDFRTFIDNEIKFILLTNGRK